MWECMIIALKAGLGTALWALVTIIVLCVIGLFFGIFKKEFDVPEKPKKQKWDGISIVKKGGKQDE